MSNHKKASRKQSCNKRNKQKRKNNEQFYQLSFAAQSLVKDWVEIKNTSTSMTELVSRCQEIGEAYIANGMTQQAFLNAADLFFTEMPSSVPEPSDTPTLKPSHLNKRTNPQDSFKQLSPLAKELVEKVQYVWEQDITQEEKRTLQAALFYDFKLKGGTSAEIDQIIQFSLDELHDISNAVSSL